MNSAIKLSDILPIDNLKSFKTHFAVWNQEKEPLDVFVNNREEWHGWNSYKGKTNHYNRDYIFSLIKVPSESNIWLFGGIYKVHGIEGESYRVSLANQASEHIGRLKIYYVPRGRNRRVNLEGCFENFMVSEILKEPYSGEQFPGFEDISMSYRRLQSVIVNDRPDWKAALKNVKGVYLVTDKKSGKIYVGSAYGGDGIWSRWREYIHSGHGGNKELLSLVDSKGMAYVETHFIFTLLEYHSAKTDDDYICKRESFWKHALQSRGVLGHNKN